MGFRQGILTGNTFWRLEVDVVKILNAIAVSTGIMLLVGCTQTTVVKDNSVAAMMARSMPAGNVAQGNKVVKASANALYMPSLKNITAAENTAKAAAATATPPKATIGGIVDTLSPANIESAIHTVLSQASTPQRHPFLGQYQQPNSPVPAVYGPPPFSIGTFNAPILYGPGPVFFNVPSAGIFTPSH